MTVLYNNSRMRGKLALWVLPLLLPLSVHSQNLAQFEKQVTEFALPNGLHFVVLERHQAPVVSFSMHVNAGAVDDPAGRTGLAHMFEHMIGKGTPSLGTEDYLHEKEALDEVEAVYDRIDAERNKGTQTNARVLESLQAELQVAIDKANGYVDSSAYFRVIQQNGAVGFSAVTGMDSTSFSYSLPANRIELWFLLQSEWLRQPVFREFYKERDVLRNERGDRVESNPQGKLREMLMSTAFTVHPYRHLGGGSASDISSLRASDARAFFHTYYVPANITVGIAGDVNPADVRRLADKYFRAIPAGPRPPALPAVEPRQVGEKRVAVETPSQPMLFLAYKRPDQYDKDDAAFDVLGAILSSGRTGWLYKDLVRDQSIALVAAAAATYPSGRYPCLFAFFAVPSPGHGVLEDERAIYAVLERLKREKVDPASLDRAKTQLRATMIRQLDSNSGLAAQLATFQAAYGNWRKLFTVAGEFNQVTADDVQRLARTYFSDSARTVAWTVPSAAATKGVSR